MLQLLSTIHVIRLLSVSFSLSVLQRKTIYNVHVTCKMLILNSLKHVIFYFYSLLHLYTCTKELICNKEYMHQRTYMQQRIKIKNMQQRIKKIITCFKELRTNILHATCVRIGDMQVHGHWNTEFQLLSMCENSRD